MWYHPVPGGTPHKLFVEKGAIQSIAVSPDGKRLAYTRGRTSREIWALENFLPPAAGK